MWNFTSLEQKQAIPSYNHVLDLQKKLWEAILDNLCLRNHSSLFITVTAVAVNSGSLRSTVLLFYRLLLYWEIQKLSNNKNYQIFQVYFSFSNEYWNLKHKNYQNPLHNIWKSTKCTNYIIFLRCYRKDILTQTCSNAE